MSLVGRTIPCMTTPADSEDHYDTTYPLPYAPPDGATAAADIPQAATEHFGPYQQVPPGQAPPEQGSFAQAAPEQGSFAQAAPEQGSFAQAAPEQVPFAQAASEQAPFVAPPPEPVPGESTQPGMNTADAGASVESTARGHARWRWVAVTGVVALASGVGVGVLVTPDPTQTPEYHALAGELSEMEQGRDELSEDYSA